MSVMKARVRVNDLNFFCSLFRCTCRSTFTFAYLDPSIDSLSISQRFYTCYISETVVTERYITLCSKVWIGSITLF